MELKRKQPPNPNGNPNFKNQWQSLGETSPVRLPKNLHLVFRQLATAINSGTITITDLENIGDSKPILAIAVSAKSESEVLKKLNQFEELQKQSWGKSSKQRGEFNTNSPRWTKYNEFKAWLANQEE